MRCRGANHVQRLRVRAELDCGFQGVHRLHDVAGDNWERRSVRHFRCIARGGVSAVGRQETFDRVNGCNRVFLDSNNKNSGWFLFCFGDRRSA